MQISGFQTFRPNKESNEEIKTGGKRKFVFVDHKQVALAVSEGFLIIEFILFDLLDNYKMYQNVMLFECPSSSPRHLRTSVSFTGGEGGGSVIGVRLFVRRL